MSFLLLLLIVGWLTGCGAFLVLPAVLLGAQAAPEPVVVAYYPSWAMYRSPAYTVADIPADQLTHLNYAFVGVSREGECALVDPWADTDHGDGGHFGALGRLKAEHPHLEVLLAVGGWTLSGRFSDTALTPESRERFARSCVALMRQHGFDGLDLDWEYPTGGGDPGNTERPEDPAHFVPWLAEVRRQLDAAGAADGRTYRLTIAGAAGQRYISGLDWAAIVPLLDWINIMAYDMAGTWDTRTGHHAPLYAESEGAPSAQTAIAGYLAAGVPAEKLTLGVPFYARGFAEVSPQADGLGQPFAGVPGDPAAGGALAYDQLLARVIPAATRHWSAAAGSPWLYDAAARTFYSYDDPESLRLKGAFAAEQGLRGVMLWEIAQDDDAHSLLAALRQGLLNLTP